MRGEPPPKVFFLCKQCLRKQQWATTFSRISSSTSALTKAALVVPQTSHSFSEQNKSNSNRNNRLLSKLKSLKMMKTIKTWFRHWWGMKRDFIRSSSKMSLAGSSNNYKRNWRKYRFQRKQLLTITNRLKCAKSNQLTFWRNRLKSWKCKTNNLVLTGSQTIQNNWTSKTPLITMQTPNQTNQVRLTHKKKKKRKAMGLCLNFNPQSDKGVR